MFTDEIKEATLENHQQVEKVLVTRMKAMRSMNDYTALLQMFYGYFGGLEKMIKPYITSNILADHNDRRKTEALVNDLETLNAGVPTTANETDLPVITNYLQAFGALYVIEGSTLGGKIISQMMQKHLHFNGNEGLSFFEGYGDDTMPMWENFKQALNNVVKNDDDASIVLKSANDTFARFKAWIEK